MFERTSLSENTIFRLLVCKKITNFAANQILMNEIINISDQVVQRHFICEEDYRTIVDTKHTFSYVVCFEGSVRVSADNMTYELQKNQLLEITQPVVCRIEAYANSEVVFNSISSAFGHALAFPELLELSIRQKSCRMVKLSGEQRMLLENSMNAMKIIAGIEDSLSSLQAAKCVVQLQYFLAPALKTIDKSLKKAKIVEDFHAHLRAHYADQYTIEMYAALLHISRTTLATTLKTYTGQTVKQLVDEERLKQARILLSRGKLNYSEIAEAIGFSDLASFSHFFKSKTGLTPSEYEKKIK